MKTLIVFFTDLDPMGYPFNSLRFLEIYERVVNALLKEGVQTFFARGNAYLGNGEFKNLSKFVDGKIVEVEGTVKADLIYNKNSGDVFVEISDCPIINQFELEKICGDKVLTAKTFPEISPITAVLNSYQQFLDQNFDPEKLVVLKQNYGWAGEGVFILPAKEVTEDLYANWADIILQEFLDSSVGIPGVTDSYHDLRVCVVDNKPTNALVRIPKEGTLTANISLGGSGLSIALDEVPQEVYILLDQITQKLDKYSPSIYAADFMNSQEGWKLIELNARPGLLHEIWTKYYNDFNQAVIDLIVKTINE